MGSGDRFCWACGSGIWGNDRFCRTCGEDLNARVPLGQERGAEPEVTSKAEPEVTSKVEPEVTSKAEPEVTSKVEQEATSKAEPEVKQPRIATGTTNRLNANYPTGFEKGLYTLGVILGWSIVVYGAITGIRSLLLDLDSGLTPRLLLNQVATAIIVGLGILIARFCGKARRRIRHSHTAVSAPVTTRWYSREFISKALTFINYKRGPVYANLKAIEHYDEAINRGAVYDSLGQDERAIQDYDEAIRLNPQHAKAYNNRGAAYRSLGQDERAIQDYDEAIRLNPQYAKAYYNRGISYSALGKEQGCMRVLVVGLGGIGQRHMRNLRTLLRDEVEILAQRSRGLGHVLTDNLTIQPNADLETDYGIKSFVDLDEALSQQPDAVFVTNPSSLHLPVALAAAEANCHLFIEKPLSNSMDGVDKLLELLQRHQLVSLIGYQLRFHPCFRLVKRLIEEEAIGPLLSARLEIGEYLAGWHSFEDYRQMYASRRNMGGGVILSQIHELDLVYWWFGMPQRLFALGGHWSSLEIDVEDTSSILLECEYDGRPLPVHVHQDYLQRPPSRTCQIIGERGKIFVDIPALEVRVVTPENPDGRLHRFEGFQRNQLFLDELAHFLACLAGEEKPIVDVYDGTQSLRIALAAHKSIESKGAVNL